MTSPVRTSKARLSALGYTQVIERGKGFLKTRNPATGAFALETVVGGRGWHFGSGALSEANEIDTAWQVGDSTPYRRRMLLADYNAYAGLNDGVTFNAGQIVKYVHPASGAEVTFQPQTLQWTNDANQLQTIGNVAAVDATVTENLLRWTNAFGTGRHFEWDAQPTHLKKRLIIDSLASLPTPNATILSGANPCLRLQFILSLSAGIDTYVDGVLWTRGNNTNRTTTGAIEFRSGSTVLWSFAPAVAFDSGTSKTRAVVLQRGRVQAGNLFIEIRVPWSWIQTAVFPIVIDPTIDESPAASADDAHQVGVGTAGVLTTGSGINIWSSIKYAGLRFQTIALDGTETITSSTYIRLWIDTFNTIDATIHGLLGDVAAFTTATNDITGRSTTTASTSWVATGTNGAYNNSPALDTEVQEIIDGTWATGNDMGIRLAQLGAGCDFLFRDYDWAEADKYPILHIEYTTGAAAASLLYDDRRSRFQSLLMR